jgi:hypothetical protein
MDGNQEAQTQALRATGIKWADQVWTGRFAQAEAWFSLQYCVMKLLEYPFMATSLSKTQCKLPAISINRHLTHT